LLLPRWTRAPVGSNLEKEEEALAPSDEGHRLELAEFLVTAVEDMDFVNRGTTVLFLEKNVDEAVVEGRVERVLFQRGRVATVQVRGSLAGRLDARTVGTRLSSAVNKKRAATGVIGEQEIIKAAGKGQPKERELDEV